MIRNIVLSITIAFLLTGCSGIEIPAQVRAIFNRLEPELKQHNVVVGDPVFIRIFKEEHILELWMKSENTGRYTLVKTYPICKWSGALGPKFYEGDRQAPEGFYATDLQQLNPNSQYHLSFNIGFPNAYDISKGRTGSFIMVHGDCVSEGCYAMTDRKIEEIYVLVERALIAGQREVPVHVFPFKMTNERMRYEFASPHFEFWQNLQQGYNYFERNGIPPMWIVKDGAYDFY